MKKLELGQSYDAEELAEICGQEEDIRYGYHAFVGDKATVIAQDEGNGVVKVTDIIRRIPFCPKCGQQINTIYTSRTVHLKHKDGKWVEEQVDHYCTYQCSVCSEELDAEDLDKLGVPNEIR